jgi:hypothetical protein
MAGKIVNSYFLPAADDAKVQISMRLGCRMLIDRGRHGMRSRGGQVLTSVVPNRKKKALGAEVRKDIESRFCSLYRCPEVLQQDGEGLCSSSYRSCACLR